MGGSVGKSKNSASNQSQNSSENNSRDSSQFSQNIAGIQQPYLDAMYSRAADLNNYQQPGNLAMADRIGSYMNTTADQAQQANANQMAGGAYQNMGLQDTFNNSIQNSLNNPSESAKMYAGIMGGQGNNYADAMKQSYLNDATMARDNMMSNLDSRAAGVGASGSSRQGVATALGNRDISANLQNVMAKTGYDTFDKDLQQKMNIAGMADANTMNRQNLLSSMIGQQQGVMNEGVNNAGTIQNLGMGQFAAQQLPWQGFQNLQGINGAPTVLNSGSSQGMQFGRSQGTGSGSSSGKGSSMSGGVGGGKGK